MRLEDPEAQQALVALLTLIDEPGHGDPSLHEHFATRMRDIPDKRLYMMLGQMMSEYITFCKTFAETQPDGKMAVEGIDRTCTATAFEAGILAVRAEIARRDAQREVGGAS